MKAFNYFIFIIFIQLAVRAGNDPALVSAREDINRINAYYAKTPNFSFDTYYKVFTEHNEQSVLEAKNGKYVRYNKNIYVRIDDIETIAINDKLIGINKEDKRITVGDNRELDLHPLQTNVDSLLTLCSEIKVEVINDHEKKYKLFFTDSPVSEYGRVDIQIDTKNNRFVKIVLFYEMAINLKNDFYAEEKQPRLEISYNNFRILTVDPLIFNEGIYIVNDKSKLKPASKYYNYSVSDLRNQTRIKK